MKGIWLIIVFICGVLLPFQTGLNAKLGKSIESPGYASLLSFIVGALTVAIYLQFTRESLSWAGLKTASLYSIIGGGIIGAFFITASMLALPRIGMGLTFGIIIAGQMVTAVLLDQFNIMVSQQHSINAWRIIGVLLIISGVVIIKRF
ncbi:MAG: DMT family transporter [Chitinophagaceae bacterium]